MTRRALDPAKVATIYELRARGMTVDAIYDEFGKGIARGTVAKYTKAYENLPPSIKERYRTVDFDHFEAQTDLPLSAAGVVLRAWAFTGSGPRPSVAMARALWRMHVIMPDMPIDALYRIADTFVSRETHHEMRGGQLVTDDIWAWLVEVAVPLRGSVASDGQAAK